MKKLLFLPALLFITATAVATPQDDIAKVLAKTKYKNLMTFLSEVSNRPVFCTNGIVYEEPSSLEVHFDIDYMYKNVTYKNDTVYLCRDKANVGGRPSDSGVVDENNPSLQFFAYYNDSLYYSSGYVSLTGMDHAYTRDLEFSLNKKNEIEFIALNYCTDSMLHIAYHKYIVISSDTYQEQDVKIELIDNDINGRVAITNNTKNDSAFVNIQYDNKRIPLPVSKYWYCDTFPGDFYMENHYKGCVSYQHYNKYDAVEMPRIHDTLTLSVHDTLTLTVHDTIYITKKDTIYLNTGVQGNAQSNLNIYPNPTVSYVTVDGDAEFSYVLTNSNGTVLKKEENEISYMIDMSQYPAGVYFLRTSDGTVNKIVKE